MTGLIIIPFRGLSSEERSSIVKVLKNNKTARYVFYALFIAIHIYMIWFILFLFEAIGRLS